MSNKMIIKQIANELAYGKEKKEGNGYRTKCPCHDDTDLSLKVWEASNGQIRFSCDAGCKNRDIRTAIDDSGLLQAPAPPKGGIWDQQKPNDKGHREGNLISLYGMSSTDFLAKEFDAPDVYIPNLLRSHSINLWYADPGVGKTTIALSAACGLTSANPIGIPFGPWTISKGSGVLFVDGEMPGYDLNAMLAPIRQTMGEEHATRKLTIFSSTDLQAQTGKPINIRDEQCRADMTEHFATNPECRVLILDNLTSLTDGLNENVKMEWAPITRWLLVLRNMGVSIIQIHHSNKGGTDRGHSCIRDNVNNVIKFKRKSKVVDKLHVEVIFQKGRHLKPGEGAVVELELVEDESGGLKLVSPNSPE